MKWIVLMFIVLSVIADAISEALRDNGEKPWSHVVKAWFVVFIMSAAIITPYIVEGRVVMGVILYYFGMLLIQRMMLFDIFYNVTRGLPIGYIGNTSFYDRFLRKIKMAPDSWLWIRGVIWIGYTFGVMLNY